MGQLSLSNGKLATVGNGTLTAALLAGGTITRTGPTAVFADTFATAAQIASYFNSNVNGYGGNNFQLQYNNTTAFVATLTAPAGGNFTLQSAYAGATVSIPATSGVVILIQVTPQSTVTVTVLNRFSLT